MIGGRVIDETGIGVGPCHWCLGRVIGIVRV